jgi:hypothetical protein
LLFRFFLAFLFEVHAMGAFVGLHVHKTALGVPDGIQLLAFDTPVRRSFHFFSPFFSGGLLPPDWIRLDNRIISKKQTKVNAVLCPQEFRVS